MNCGHEGFEYFCPSCGCCMKFIEEKSKTSMKRTTTPSTGSNTAKFVSSNNSNSLNYTNISNKYNDALKNVQSSSYRRKQWY